MNARQRRTARRGVLHRAGKILDSMPALNGAAVARMAALIVHDDVMDIDWDKADRLLPNWKKR